MAKKLKTTVDAGYQYQQIALERTLWVIKPVALVAMTMWCLYPSHGGAEALDRKALAGFLMGAGYGILVNRHALKYFLFTRRKEKRHERNTLPDHYYFGNILEDLVNK